MLDAIENSVIAKTRRASAKQSERGFSPRTGKFGAIASRLRVQLVLLVSLSVINSPVTARSPLLTARGAAAAVAPRSFRANGAVASVDSVGMTVSDADRAVEFFSKVLSFEKVSDVEVAGSEYEHLQGVFGLRIRV